MDIRNRRVFLTAFASFVCGFECLQKNKHAKGEMMIIMGNACEFQRPKRRSLPAVSMPLIASITSSSCNPPQGMNEALITATDFSCKL